MIRTVIRHSQRFAGLMLLAALAVIAPSAQTQDKKAVVKKPASTSDLLIRCCPGKKEIAKKPAERILETDKSPALRATVQKGEQKETLVKKPTGVSPKTTTEQQGGGGQQGIAVGEPNGGIRRKVEEQKDAPKKAVEEAGGVIRRRVEEQTNTPKQTLEEVEGRIRRVEGPISAPKTLKEASDGLPARQRGELGPLTPATGVPQKAIEKREAGDLKCADCRRVKQNVPSGISPKVEPKETLPTRVVKEAADAKQIPAQRGIAVGETNGKQEKRLADGEETGIRRHRVEETTQISQKTKDAAGSPQKVLQKGDGAVKREAIETTDLRSGIKLEPLSIQDGGKGAVIERKPKEEATDFAKQKNKKVKTDKTDTKLAKEEAPGLVKRRNK